MSWLNLVEFSKLTDGEQAGKADELLDQILPHVSFLNPNFFTVIKEEDKLQAGNASIAPHADLVMLKFFIKHNLSKPNSLELLPKQNLFRVVQASGTAGSFERFADLIIKRIDSLRQDYVKNRDFSLAVKRLPKGQPIQRGTRFIARELFGTLLTDERLKIDRNHAIDICHAIVPVAYCDFVLLDAHWTRQVERVRQRVSAGGMDFPIAKAFSERDNGMERFFRELESGSKAKSVAGDRV